MIQVLFGDEEIASQILQSDDPHEQKQFGREIRNFDEKVWAKHRWNIVMDGNLAKVSIAMTTHSDSQQS